MIKRLSGVLFAVVVLCSWLPPQGVEALPQGFSLFPTAFIDPDAPSELGRFAFSLFSDRPINDTIFWRARFFGSCSEGPASAGTGCSLSLADAAPGLVEFSIDFVPIGTIGTALNFSGPGPNQFDFEPVIGSFDCTLVTGCDEVEINLSFLGSGGSDTYNQFGIIISFSDTPFPASDIVPAPVSLLLLATGFGVLVLTGGCNRLRRRAR